MMAPSPTPPPKPWPLCPHWLFLGPRWVGQGRGIPAHSRRGLMCSSSRHWLS